MKRNDYVSSSRRKSEKRGKQTKRRKEERKNKRTEGMPCASDKGKRPALFYQSPITENFDHRLLSKK